MLNNQKCNKVLFVDDESAILKSIKRMSVGEKWNGYFATSAKEGMTILREHNIDVVLSDMRMPGLCGSDFLIQVKKEFPGIQRLLMTGYSDISAIEKTVNEAGIVSYISKPWSMKYFVETVNRAIDLQKTESLVRVSADRSRLENQKLSKLAFNLKGLLKDKDIEARQALATLNLEHRYSNQRFRSLLNVLSRAMRSNELGLGDTQFMMETAIQMATKLCLDGIQIDNLLFAMQLYTITKVHTRENNTIDMRASYQAQIAFSSKILFGLSEFSDVLNILKKHKEHINGSGYPNRALAQDIPIEARIMCVITQYILLSLGKSRSNIKGHEQAKHFMTQKAGQYYDPDIIDIFFTIVNENTPFGNSTILSLKNSDLRPGMKLAKNLLSQEGTVLLKVGTFLNEELIHKLHSYEKSRDFSLIVHVMSEIAGNKINERRSVYRIK